MYAVIRAVESSIVRSGRRDPGGNAGREGREVQFGDVLGIAEAGSIVPGGREQRERRVVERAARRFLSSITSAEQYKKLRGHRQNFRRCASRDCVGGRVQARSCPEK